MRNLGRVLRELGEPATARALRINETTYGPDHPHVASTLNNLAEALRDLKELAAARPLLERALHINETTYGPDRPASVYARQALQQLGDVVRLAGSCG